MRFRSTITILGFVLIATGFSCALLSQSQSGTILGTITDESKNLVPGVTVTAVEAQSGKRLSAVSDRNGNYNLAGLEPGAYTLTAVLPGFETVTFTGVALAAQGQSRLDFTLRIAARRNGLMPLAPSGPRDRVVDIRADSMTA